MPKPKQGESEADYVGRCVPVVMKDGTAKDNEQAVAVCHSMFKQHGMAANLAAGLTSLVANLSGRVRREKLYGRDFIVAPMTLIVPGVLNGSAGPLYYPEDELERDPSIWNGIPIVVNHPMKNGKPLHARDPEVLNKFGIGFLFRSKAAGKLTTEGWFDIEQTKLVDNRVLEALEVGTPIELSTGLYADYIPAPADAVFNGKAYTYTVRNYRPDHLAVLPDQKGACSLDDGCGVNNADGTQANNELSHSDLHSMLYRSLRDRFKQSEPSAFISEVYDDYFVYEQDGKLYKLRYTKLEDGVNLGGSPVEVMRETTYVSVTNSEASKGDNMAKLNDTEKKKLIDNLIGNCSCSGPKPWTEEDRAALNAMSDAKLMTMDECRKAMATTEQVANAALEGFEDQQGNSHSYNAETGKWESKPKAAPVTNTDKGTQGKGEQKEMTDAEYLATLPPNMRSAVQNAMRIEQREKAALVEKLVANAPFAADAAKRKAHTTRLLEKPLEELEELVALIPAPVQNNGQQAQGQRRGYYGPSSPTQDGEGQTQNRSGDDDYKLEEDLLETPTINWQEVSDSNMSPTKRKQLAAK
jgi:hypothetical protein